MTPSPTTMWLVIVISGVLTFALRAAFILRPDTTEERSDSAALPTWLQVIAPAALGALVLPALIRPDGGWAPLGAEAGAGLVAAIVARRTGSTAWTIVTGFACLLALEAAFGHT